MTFRRQRQRGDSTATSLHVSMSFSAAKRRSLHLLIVLALVAVRRADVAHASSLLQFSKQTGVHYHASFVASSSSPLPPSSSSFVTWGSRAPYHDDVRPSASNWRYFNNRRNSPITKHYLSSKDETENSDSDDQQIATNNWRSQLVGTSSFAKYGRPSDITSDSFGPLLPIAEAVDEATGGWGLSYADLHPATPRTTIGQAFLATNFFYAAAGLWLGWQGDWFYGGLTELAGVVSFVYHYTQLEFGKNRSEVRLALLIDYFCAGAALLTGGVYMIQAGVTSVPVDALIAAGGAAACLSLCWVWEFGYPYIFWHSLWHVLSAYTGFLVGQVHLSKISG